MRHLDDDSHVYSPVSLVLKRRHKPHITIYHLHPDSTLSSKSQVVVEMSNHSLHLAAPYSETMATESALPLTPLSKSSCARLDWSSIP